MRQVIGNFLDGRVPRFLLTLSAVTLAASFLAGAAVALLIPPKLPRLPGDSALVADVAARVEIPPLKAFSPILDRNPFKAAMPKPPPPPKPRKVTLDQLPVVNLNVRLLGTMAAENVEFSRAVVLEGDKQQLIRIGQKLAGYTVSEIQRRAIVLTKGKKRQLLLIDAEDRKIAAGAGNARKMLSRKAVKARFQNLDSLAQDIQLVPATRGKQEGLWVRHLRPASLFGRAGLRRDDVLLTVQGEPVATANPLSLFRLLDEPQIRVELLREGQPMQLVLILTGS